MAILNQDMLFSLAAVTYLGLAIHFWRSRWLTPTPGGKPSTALERAAGVLGIVLHGLGLISAMFGESLQFSFALALSCMFWFAAILYAFEGVRIRLEALHPLIYGPAAALCIMPIVFARTHALPSTNALGFGIHFFAAMLAYSLFALAVLHAIFINFAERQLHMRTPPKHLAGLFALPPILTLEALLFRMIALAFALLNVAMLSGVGFSEAIYGKPASLDHKTIFTLISWVIFGALLFGRWRYGWRGRIAQRWLFSGFGALLLGYVGSRFVMEVILGR